MKQSKRSRDIRAKLISAVCMLMVSVIMLTSTTYAWFTLSTAPEVKGIQTSVGANGNLEMALLSTQNTFTNPDEYISSAVGDSSATANKSALTANVTWGNLVDLSDNAYGLSLISLLPSALQNTVIATVGEDGTLFRSETLTNQLLAIPTYGADGRVNELTAENTILAPFSESVSAFAQVTDSAHPDAIRYGVRAVGTSSNRSLREITYDSMLSQAGVLASQFKIDAIASLGTYGNGLANMAIKNANGTNSFTKDEVAAIYGVIDGVLGTRKYKEDADKNLVRDGREDDGLVSLAMTALQYYAAAAFASELNETSYANDAAFTEALNDTDAILKFAENIQALQELLVAITALENAAEAADGKLDYDANASKETYTWAEISGAIGELFDASKLDVWGMSIGDLKDKEFDELFTILGENNNQVIANIKGGIYSLMADLCGDFNTKTKLFIQEGQLEKVPAMLVAKKNAGPYLSAANTAVSAVSAPKGQGDSPMISDAYGYVIDLAFRTNASNSNLLLQTAATQRISTSTSESTLGGGSSMTFRSGDENFGTDLMANLMENIVLVFYTPNEDGTNDILCTAKLDMGETGKVDGNGDPELDEDGKQVMEPNYTVSETSRSITANLYIVQNNYAMNDDGIYQSDEDGNAIKTDDTLITDQTKAVITAMPANTAQKVSVLVYLNGETITNADVAVGNTSMTGTLNLQFSSSANLVPMGYTGTMAPANEAVKYTVEYNTTDLATGLAVSGESTAVSGRDYIFSITGNVDTCEATAMVYKAGENGTYAEEGTAVTVKKTDPSHFTIDEAEITGKLVITVTGTAKAEAETTESSSTETPSESESTGEGESTGSEETSSGDATE